MGILLKASEADWALAKRRERVLSTFAESKECSRAMMQKACAALQLSRAMVFRLLARYREDPRLSALLLHPGGLSVEVEGSEKSRSRSLLRISARSVGRSGRLLPYTERSPQLVENVDFRFPPMEPCCDAFKPTPDDLPEPLGWLAVY